MKFLVFQDFELSDLWKIYEKSIEIGRKISEKQVESKTSIFYFNLRIPLLILLYELVNCNEIKIIKNPESSSYYNIFDNLCEIIDSKNQVLSNESDKVLKQITKEILKNGVLVFFPDEKTRKECFLKMVENNIDNEKKDSTCLMNVKTDFSFSRYSTQLLFEAFCNLFCMDKYSLVKYLINNSENLFETSDSCNETINFIDKLIKFGFFLNRSKETDDKLIIALNELLNSIQSNIFFCMKEQLVLLKSSNSENSTNTANKSHSDVDLVENNIKKFLLDYSNLVVEKGTHIINSILENDKTNISFKDNLRLKNYLTKIIYNFVLWLSELFNQLDLSVCTKINRILIHFHHLIIKGEHHFQEVQVSS